MGRIISFTIPGEPVPKQSARFRIAGSGKKQFVQSYQPKEIKDAENYIKRKIKEQLPENWEPIDNGVKVIVNFYFEPPKSWSNKKRADAANNIHFKITKPDLTDNLMKGLIDAMDGILYTNDSRICIVESRKQYYHESMTHVIIEEIIT